VYKRQGQINLANLTDGLRAEREQGITIDVAYRYFATPKRKFIVADTPGHVQYTRNMVTGAVSYTHLSRSELIGGRTNLVFRRDIEKWRNARCPPRELLRRIFLLPP